MSNPETHYVTKGHVVHTRNRKILKAGQAVHRADFGDLNWKDLKATGQIKTFQQIEEETKARLAKELPVEPEEELTDNVSLLNEENVLDPEKAPVVAKAEGTDDPKTPEGPWCEDPESLKDMDLEDLQLMIVDRDRDGSMEQPPETKEECIAHLSSNFAPTPA